MGKYLTDKERYQLEYMYNIQHLSQREIARQLHKHYNTICNEIKRGTTTLLNSDLTERQQYCADVAINKYRYNCTAKGAPLKINNDYEYKLFIEKQIKNNHYSFYSANELAKNENFNTRVCLSTLYNYFHSNILILGKVRCLLNEYAESNIKSKLRKYISLESALLKNV